MFLTHHRIFDPSSPHANERGYREPTISEVARHFKIPRTTISSWASNPRFIEEAKKRVYHPRWPELEEELVKRFIAARANKSIVTVSWFKRQARSIFKSLNPAVDNIFTFSNGWWGLFRRRHAPEEYIEIVNSFLRYIRRVSRRHKPQVALDAILNSPTRRFGKHRILNLDETPIPFEYLDGYTYEQRGARTIDGKSDRSGWNKRQATLILYIFADGIQRLKPKLRQHKVVTALIPPGCTSLLQPLDTAINRPLKDWLRDATDEYVSEREARGLTMWSIREKRIMTTFVVASAVRTLESRAELVQKAFLNCGISIRPDGTQDIEIRVKDIPAAAIDFTNWEQARDVIVKDEEGVSGLLDEEEIVKQGDEAEDRIDRETGLLVLRCLELKALLRARGLSTIGKKAVLIARLLDADSII
ncbi:SAP domain-containing protein [Hirsutella rhossiliensis]|uniref:SAP domain-containing protein n=1 Tax=Hirsutella rhossiliensis TaxID=111463 RepID=A0A9P8N1Z4_9HYPO|nr:SAP domain-containing protein [Hirsutella rhossiliensis]KAH0965410.1 SAP domain-containing protein [Hirsutella rhossiliensis]